jgi:hypothetical protein
MTEIARSPIHPPRCQSCGDLLLAGNAPCRNCGVLPGVHPGAGPFMPPIMVAPKSAGIAVVLNVLWLGAGCFYLRKWVPGIILAVIDFFLVLLLFTVIGAIIAIPVWVVLFVIAAIYCVWETGRENQKMNPYAIR